MTWANRNQAWGEVLVDELARCRLEHATLAPGSRSTPLVLALAQHEDITLHTHLDERSASYFALGIGKASGRPAAVVTTSGTAAVNLHPAVVEASASDVPLIALTADRPHRLRGADANQTIDQVHLYGRSVRAFHELPMPEVTGTALLHLRQLACRAWADAHGPPAGPVHLNVPFEKPLEPTPVQGDVPSGFAERHTLAARGRPHGAPFVAIHRPPPLPDPRHVQALAGLVQEAACGLILAGPHPDPATLGPAAVALARATGYPLLADPLSGARFTPGAVGHGLTAYDHVLRAEAAAASLEPELILRLGATPTSKHLTRFLQLHTGARQVVIDAGSRYKDHLAVATEHITADPAGIAQALGDHLEAPVADKAWTSRWHELEAAARQQLSGAVDEAGWFEGPAVAAVADAVPAGTQLFISNSMPVRDLDGYAGPRDEAVPVHGNRGASGIDGIVSTAAGLAAADGPTVAVVGDLALLHDVNGLHVAAQEALPLVLVVLNNDGGGIFHMLPIREHEPAFTAHFATPHGRDLAHGAALYGVPHTLVDDAAELPALIQAALKAGGPQVLEVRTDREENRRRHEAVAQATERAVTRTLQGGPP